MSLLHRPVIPLRILSEVSRVAFWQRKSNNRVFVYYWCRQSGKQKPLPREATSHLDLASDAEVQTWVDAWATSWAQPVQDESSLVLNTREPEKPKPITDSKLIGLVDDFCRYQREGYGKHPNTVWAHQQNLLHWALPYFVHEKEIMSLAEMKNHSSRLNDDFKSRLKLPPSRIRNIQMSLRMFWRWLEEEGQVEGRLVLRKSVVPKAATPLRRLATPEEFLAWASEREDLRLLGLVIYFFSLRPQEAFSLTRKHFLAGERATHMESSRAMREAGLYDRFVVKIEQQRSRKIGLAAPKAGSVGVVSCFNEKAAREIIGLINTKKPNEPLFPFGNDCYYQTWRRFGYPDLTLKDCRRASLYWLGHYSKLDIVAIRNHARHADISTTSLYTRRPSDSFEELNDHLVLD